MVFDQIIVFKIKDKDFNIFLVSSNFGFFYRIRRVRQDFSTYEDFIGSIYQPSEIASYIRTARKLNAIKIFSLPNRKISLCMFSLCPEWDKSCPNPVNISTIRKKNLRSFLSILDRMHWAKKPSHATVPLSLCLVHCFIWFEVCSWGSGKVCK